MSNADWLAIQSLRTLSIDAIEKAQSGHPGLPLGAAPFTYILWQYFLNHRPSDPQWINRDRFILSAGHGSMLLYSLLHMTGYKVTLEDLKAFRQWGGITPGHPEAGLTPGVETTTGPLGQGAANAVGFAIAERMLAQYFNRSGHEVIDHTTYALVSDGDLMEGVCLEAVSLAGHLGLGKLIYLYDSNQVTLDGPTSLTFTSENVAMRFEACGWQVLRVRDADTDLEAIKLAIESAKGETQRPSLVILDTTIGFASPLAGTSAVHGSPLNRKQIDETKDALQWSSKEPFFVPDAARSTFAAGVARSERAYEEWKQALEKYRLKFPDLFKELTSSKGIAGDFYSKLSVEAVGKSVATRVASGRVLNEIAKVVPWLVGGDADLSSSTKTGLKGMGSFHAQGTQGGGVQAGRNIHFGVREHAMASIANGMSYHEFASKQSSLPRLRPFVSTFFCFADYMRPAIRLAAMNHLPVIYIWTHDSIGLGEDGPTHQPIEHLASLRAVPNLLIYRPADETEVIAGWKVAMEQKTRPFGFVLTRQNVPNLSRERAKGGADQGAYILDDSSKKSPDVILISTGSEVHLAVEAKKRLESEGVHARVVSMPCWKLFEEQSEDYKEMVLPQAVLNRVSIEAASTFGWERWVGTRGKSIGIDHFGASAPAEKLFSEFGITVDAVVSVSKSLTTA